MKKIKLPIKNIETNIILNALIQFKNDKLKQGIYTEPIDELILKLNKIYDVGGYWFYNGKNNVEVKQTKNGKVTYDFWKVTYHDIDFDSLTEVK